MIEPPTQDWRTDAELFEAINRSDASAFETLYGRHRDWVYRLAYRFCGNAEDALDVLQDTFTYLLRKSPNLHLSAQITTFLYPAVKNISISLIRKRRKTGGDIAHVEQNLTAPPENATASRTELADVISVLPETHREVLLMRFVDGMSLEEIASALKIPLGTVKSRVHHAIKTLRDDARTKRYFEP